MKNVLLYLAFALPFQLLAQQTDTLTFQSEVFQQERTIMVKLPADFKYQSKEVKLPVIYVLDGQHEWFINPVLSTIEYLQYTYEIPAAIVVVIPHQNRIRECAVGALEETLPLHQFITEELEKKLEPYAPGAYRMIIGHSLSASFALYSYWKGDGFYTSVVAHSPLQNLEPLVSRLQHHKQLDKTHIAISVGGAENDKDGNHRAQYDLVQEKYPAFFQNINTYEADGSAHNAVPIVANARQLSVFFYSFSKRYSGIATVDRNYKMVSSPESPEVELEKIRAASRLDNFFYPPEIAEINGIASRFSQSGYTDHALAVIEEGAKYYPSYYDFHLALYDGYLEKDLAKAKQHLLKAHSLLLLETALAEQEELLQAVEEEKSRHGW